MAIFRRRQNFEKIESVISEDSFPSGALQWEAAFHAARRQASIRRVSAVRGLGQALRISALSVGSVRKLHRLEGHLHRQQSCGIFNSEKSIKSSSSGCRLSAQTGVQGAKPGRRQETSHKGERIFLEKRQRHEANNQSLLIIHSYKWLI